MPFCWGGIKILQAWVSSPSSTSVTTAGHVVGEGWGGSSLALRDKREGQQQLGSFWARWTSFGRS